MKSGRANSVLLFVLSVLLFAFCQPGIVFASGLPFLAWIAYIPFFLLIDYLSIRTSFLWGAFYGFCAYAALCWWLFSYGVIALVFVCFLFACYFSLVFFLLCSLRFLLPCFFKKSEWIFRALVFLSFEYVRTHGIFAFSYGIVGYTQWNNSAFLYFSRFFGVWGITLIILLANALFAKIVFERNLKSNLRPLSFLCSLLIAVHVLPLIASRSPVRGTIHVALIQDASSADSSTLSDFVQDAELLISLTDSALRTHPETDLVVWPETAIVPDILTHFYQSHDRVRHALSRRVFDFVRSSSASFLIGTTHMNSNGDHNCALFFPHKDDENATLRLYSKLHLVPFTEFWPDFLRGSFFDRIKHNLNCDDFVPGDELVLFNTKSFQFGVPICFEDSFSPLIRNMKKKGADFFVNISDDAWAHCVQAQLIHLSMSAFRSAEYATPTIRSTINGKTCVIDTYGRVVSSLESDSDVFLCSELLIPADTQTLYFFAGDVLVNAIIAFLLLLILSGGFVKVIRYGRRKTEKKSNGIWSGNRI